MYTALNLENRDLDLAASSYERKLKMEQIRNIANNDLHLLLSLLLLPDLGVDALSDGELAGPLADLGQVGAGESLGHLGQEGQVDLLGDGALPEVGLEDGHPGALVRQRDVDELVETAGPEVR